MKKVAFLDLEDTVIQSLNGSGLGSWNLSELHYGKVRVVKSVLDDFQPDELWLFSFAVFDKQDVEHFIASNTRTQVEVALSRKIDRLLTVTDDILPAVYRQRHLVPNNPHTDHMEMANHLGKQETFRLYVRDTLCGTVEHEVLLVDDTVEDEDFTWQKLKITGHLVRV